MNRVSLFSILALAALLIVACGGAAAAPEATLGPSRPETVAKNSDVDMSDDSAAENEADHETSEDKDAMADDDDTLHDDDADKGMSEDRDMSADDDAMADDNDAMHDDSDQDMSKNDDAMADDDDAMRGDSDQEMSTEDSMADDDAMKDDDADKGMPENQDKSEGEDTMSNTTEDGSGSEAMVELPAWFTAPLIDVNTGETFTIADLKDQVLLVETMAIWCSNCLRQQKEVKVLHEALANREGWATVVLDIDPNEKEGALQAYSAQHGFDWTYAVAPREVAREIGQLYGSQFLNPPSTPMLLIDSQGDVHLLPFGRKDASELQETVESFLDGS